ncbi:MAG TPA: DUF1553 domain-containing protein [Planctomycetes bacterium]|nr:DUF1553 domain-containing protein [Planctomycetota bacterium]
MCCGVVISLKPTMLVVRGCLAVALVCWLTSVTDADDAVVHWSFQKLTRPAPPATTSLKHSARVRNPIDQFVLQSLEEAGLEPAPAADRLTLVRRACFDLLGLPPTPEQVDAFLQDESADAWSRLIDSLLASKHYGERWGRHWLDVARYADSGGYETDIYYRNAWRYRDYVVNSFNNDKPYDIFVQEQIAGDELWPNNLDLDPRRVYIVSDQKKRHLEARIGTGFYALGPRIHESALDARRLAYERLTDWADTTASAFMGVTLACARCHDHKFDPFTQDDYFSLQAIFADARETELPLWNSMGEADWRQAYPRVVAVQEARTRYRLFEAETQGKPLSPEQQAAKQELLAAIGQSVLALPTATAGQGTIPYDGLMHIPTASVLGREHPALIKPVHLLDRGELHHPQHQLRAALPVSLAEATATSPALPDPYAARKQFALWLTRKDHPLTGRVIVNRIWHWHFGRGIVETPNDFGVMGQPPSHPELLDWLATGFVADGWKIKNLHRLIMNSSVYRRSSQFGTERHLAEDFDNRLLWRMNRRRLEAEALWDNVHSSAGTINLAMGGPPVVPPLAADEIASLREQWHWVVSADPAQHSRRGIYILVRRNFKFPMFEVFDAPITSQSCPVRDVTTVAPQALWGLNNNSVFRQAMHMAGRVVREAGADRTAQIVRAWRIALSRPARQDEFTSAVRLLEELEKQNPTPLHEPPESLKSVPPATAQALTKLCLALFNLSEFAFVD